MLSSTSAIVKTINNSNNCNPLDNVQKILNPCHAVLCPEIMSCIIAFRNGTLLHLAVNKSVYQILLKYKYMASIAISHVTKKRGKKHSLFY